MLNEYSNTIDPHYSRFSNCKLAYLPKFICYSKVNTCGIFLVNCGHAEWWKFWVAFPAEVGQDYILPFHLQPSCWKQLSVQGLFSAMFCLFVLHFLLFVSNFTISQNGPQAQCSGTIWCSQGQEVCHVLYRENTCVR